MKLEGCFFFISSGTGPADSGAQVGARMGVFVGRGVKVTVGEAVIVGVPVGVGGPPAKAVPTAVTNTKIERILVFINSLLDPTPFKKILDFEQASLQSNLPYPKIGQQKQRNPMPYPKVFYEVLILESHLDTFGHVNNAS